jgi:uncharacterized protein YbbC (DUF1343 family)
VGLITNHSGRLPGGTFLVDSLLSLGIRVVALFGPEHGIRGDSDAGASIMDSVDAQTGIPVYSLYGPTTKPTPSMLQGTDVLIYDIQDVGVRFYTYISTMYLCMEAAAEAKIPFIVLDRPNPLGGIRVEGPIIEDSLRSFVGKIPVPVVYGLTSGELARMINGEGWLANGIRADLRVIPMSGWTRHMLWEETGLGWIPPSPNLRTPEATLAYPGTCLIEATNISEGRGTSNPFLTIGAPFLRGNRLWSAMTGLGISGAEFRSVRFTPESSKFKGIECRGITIGITDSRKYDPVRTGLYLVQALLRLDSVQVVVNQRRFGRLIGAGGIVEKLRNGKTPESICSEWETRINDFRRISSKYFLYQ